MAKADLIRRMADLRGRSATDFEKREEPTDVLLCPPDHFDIIDVKNPHMEGQIGNVDLIKAEKQWKSLREAMVATGRRVRLLEPTPGLEDMVFTANPVLPGLGANGERICLLSNMKHPSRKREVAAHEAWFKERGYRVVTLTRSDWLFEGQGDALWHPGRKLLWGGFGFRSVPEVYDEIATVFSTPVVLMELEEEDFYHLDTCFCPLSESEALFYPQAFQPEDQKLIRALFRDAIEVPEKEAREGFACNALALGQKVLLERGNIKTNAMLRKRGYEPVELDTSEFIKSGGSVFCMKMMVYA